MALAIGVPLAGMGLAAAGSSSSMVSAAPSASGSLDADPNFPGSRDVDQDPAFSGSGETSPDLDPAQVDRLATNYSVLPSYTGLPGNELIDPRQQAEEALRYETRVRAEQLQRSKQYLSDHIMGMERGALRAELAQYEQSGSINAAGTAWSTMREQGYSVVESGYGALSAFVYEAVPFVRPLTEQFYNNGQDMLSGRAISTDEFTGRYVGEGFEAAQAAIGLRVARGTTRVRASTAGVETEYVNLASERATNHILYGDGPTSGGHMWPGNPGKTLSPKDWSAEKIMHVVSDIATDPNLPWIQQRGMKGSYYTKKGSPAVYKVEGTRFGSPIRVILTPANGEIITAFPIP